MAGKKLTPAVIRAQYNLIIQSKRARSKDDVKSAWAKNYKEYHGTANVTFKQHA